MPQLCAECRGELRRWRKGPGRAESRPRGSTIGVQLLDRTTAAHRDRSPSHHLLLGWRDTGQPKQTSSTQGKSNEEALMVSCTGITKVVAVVAAALCGGRAGGAQADRQEKRRTPAARKSGGTGVRMASPEERLTCPAATNRIVLPQPALALAHFADQLCGGAPMLSSCCASRARLAEAPTRVCVPGARLRPRPLAGGQLRP